MKKTILILLITSMIGCSSTDQTTDEAITVNTPPAMPESYQIMVDFGIISEDDAQKVVNGQRKALSDNFYKFKESALGQITDGGDMFVGFGIAQLLGGGVALSDFFNPLSMFKGNQYENHFKKSYFWIEVDESCDKQCSYKKIEEILAEAAKHYADNLVKLSKLDDSEFIWKKNELANAPIRRVETLGGKKTFFGKELSTSYVTDLVVNPKGYDAFSRERPFFTIWDAGFTYVNGKRYFGSKVTTKEAFTVKLHRMGNHIRWMNDNSQTLGIAKASEKYPNFIFIETKNCTVQSEFENKDRLWKSCQGDLLINKGKLTYLHLFPDAIANKIEKSNLIGVKVHDAREEIFTEEEWKSLLEQNSAVETAGRAL